MKRRQLWSLCVFTALLVLCLQLTAVCVIPEKFAFYVSPDGNDTASGTSLVRAFATIQRARDAIRELKKTKVLPKGGVTVWVRSGEYYLKRGLELTSEDSGTLETPIVYRGMAGEQVCIIGGRKLSNWQKVQDPAILDRLDPAARKEVYQANLKAQGIDDFGQLKSRGFGRGTSPAALELFFQSVRTPKEDKPMNIARWPNDSFLKIAGYTEGKDDGDRVTQRSDSCLY